MPYDFIERSGIGAGFVYKTESAGYYMSGATWLVNSSGTSTTVMDITSVSSGVVAVGMTLYDNTGTSTGVTISSFGTFNGTTGTVNLSGALTWGATSTFHGIGFSQITDPDYPSTTVRGIVYLDGTYYVMTPDGAIHGSGINDPSSWSALNVIQSQIEPDAGVYLGRCINLIVSMGDYSIEFFYDAGNATGSPLLPYSSAALEIGCACGASVAATENMLIFMGYDRQKGRGIYVLTGTSPQKVSTPFVDRILEGDDLTNVTAYVVKVDGHIFYVLYLGQLDRTIVFDLTSQSWNEWTSTTANATKTITALSYSDYNEVTVTATSHGFSDGDLVVIAGMTPPGYNGSYTINVVDDDTFTYSNFDWGTATVFGTAHNYTEGGFNMTGSASSTIATYLQDSTTGSIYAISSGQYTDNNLPIEYRIRTSKSDFGNNNNKFFSSVQVIGDKVDSTAYVRYTNDDYQTWSAYRPVDMNQQRSILNRLGRGRRRAFEIRNHDNVPVRLESLEVTVEEGFK